MESPDLNSADPEEARLEALLRRPLPPLADDGFSARVLAALPPPVPRSRPFSLRLIVCFTGALTGALIAYFAKDYDPWAEHWVPLQVRLEPLLTSLSDPATLRALGVTAVLLLYALRPETFSGLWRPKKRPTGIRSA